MWQKPGGSGGQPLLQAIFHKGLEALKQGHLGFPGMAGLLHASFQMPTPFPLAKQRTVEIGLFHACTAQQDQAMEMPLGRQLQNATQHGWPGQGKQQDATAFQWSRGLPGLI